MFWVILSRILFYQLCGNTVHEGGRLFIKNDRILKYIMEKAGQLKEILYDIAEKSLS
jgi:hypothetical protein